MSKTTVFLSIEQILAIHNKMIEEYGGEPSIRDYGLLEVAVTMPWARYGGKHLHSTLAEMAAAYFFQLCRSHPFVDGSKQTALMACEVFLLLNNSKLSATNNQLEKLITSVANDAISKQQTIEFFKEHVTQ